MSLTIQQLESELTRKTDELNESQNAQHLLLDTLISNTKTLCFIKKKLKEIEADLGHSEEYINILKEENMTLKLSRDEWMSLAINYKLELLSIQAACKK